MRLGLSALYSLPQCLPPGNHWWTTESMFCNARALTCLKSICPLALPENRIFFLGIGLGSSARILAANVLTVAASTLCCLLSQVI